jgi:NAD(P)-dependent dehydrogenase (short-subunit alcohol dehydrogenase family)
MVVVADEPEIKTAGKDFEALGLEGRPCRGRRRRQAQCGEWQSSGGSAVGQCPGEGLAKAFSIRISMMSYAKIAPDTSERGRGRILITGSIVGFVPGTYEAVYNASKAFPDSFSHALRAELKDTGIAVTFLMPGATETEFFARADMLDTAGTAQRGRCRRRRQNRLQSHDQRRGRCGDRLGQQAAVRDCQCGARFQPAQQHRRKTNPARPPNSKGPYP